ncbi:hypothetical protein AKJ37_07125, partial [candidate division MSBL1 archaeon SCGC-AAA259I09]
KKNLEYALEAIQRFAEEVEGKIVVTSDHGEAFGEGGLWGHINKPHIPVLVEVPWLEIND